MVSQIIVLVVVVLGGIVILSMLRQDSKSDEGFSPSQDLMTERQNSKRRSEWKIIVMTRQKVPISKHSIEFTDSKVGITIGRGDSCDINIDSRSISRRHAILTKNERDELILIDNESTNGTRVETEKGPKMVASIKVKDDMLVYFADVPCRFKRTSLYQEILDECKFEEEILKVQADDDDIKIYERKRRDGQTRI